MSLPHNRQPGSFSTLSEEGGEADAREEGEEADARGGSDEREGEEERVCSLIECGVCRLRIKCGVFDRMWCV